MDVRRTTGRWMSVRSPAHVPVAVPIVLPVAVGVVGVGVVGLTRRTARQVRALRDAGARVAPLWHDLALDDGPATTTATAAATATPTGPATATGPATGGHRRVVVLGDSAAAGHGLGDPELGIARRVGRALHAIDGRATAVRSVAVDGATTTDVLHTQLDAARDAEVVIIGVGVNDAVRLRGGRRVRREIGEVLTGVRAAASPTAQLVLITCPDLSQAPGLPRILRPPMGWRCRRVARIQVAVAHDLGVAIVPLGRRSLPPEVFGPDGFHPGAVGHERLAESVVGLLDAGTDGGALG